MKTAWMGLTICIVRSRSMSQRDFIIFLHLPQYKQLSPISQLCHWSTSCNHVFSSDFNIQHFMNIIMLEGSCEQSGRETIILARCHARKLKILQLCSSAIFKNYISVSSSLNYLCIEGEVYIVEHELYLYLSFGTC